MNLNENGHGAFYCMDGPEQIIKMVVSVYDKNLTVYHTEVSTKAEGKGLAKKMLEAMVDYSRIKNLKVISLCPYVHAQFKRHAETYADVWKREQENGEGNGLVL